MHLVDSCYSLSQFSFFVPLRVKKKEVTVWSQSLINILMLILHQGQESSGTSGFDYGSGQRFDFETMIDFVFSAFSKYFLVTV